ncbi:MAG: translation initiation factor IF-3 [Oscillospiraceae bacterium]|nr:translation initiation factor IF-3 [Oscillospiraceae bacterium]
MVHQINDDIRDKEIRLIDSDGSQLGVVNTKDALRMAAERELDLVKIAPAAAPPVCKLMDYGKFRFEQAKKEKEAKKHQHIIEIKEIRLSPSIDKHDFDFKRNHARKFLEDGHKVKVSIRFRGREMAHTSIGQTQMLKFAEELTDVSNVERHPKLDGRNMLMFLAPKLPAKK